MCAVCTVLYVRAYMRTICSNTSSHALIKHVVYAFELRLRDITSEMDLTDGRVQGKNSFRGVVCAQSSFAGTSDIRVIQTNTCAALRIVFVAHFLTFSHNSLVFVFIQ
jgi:hypothetical protein